MAESTEMLPNSSEDHVSIEIGEADNLLAAQLEEKLSQTTPLSSRCCICRVPNTIGTNSRNAYEPQTVSIGPFHRGRERLQATERFKRLYLDSLVRRAPTPQTNLKCLTEAIKSLEKDSRECYEEEDIKLSSDEFVEMMLIDGCFILEMFRREAREVSIDENDPVFRTAQMQFSIKRDMILLENQIPMLILERLFDLTAVPEPEGRSLIELCLEALNYFGEIVPMDEGIDGRKTSLNPQHLLDLLRKSFIPPTIKMENHVGEHFLSVNPIEHINCATELREAGVSFKKKKKEDNASSLFDITFEKGVFKIPPLRVEDGTEIMFRNLIAFEQCYGDCDLIASYVFLMVTLISSTKDVQLLRNKGIIIHSLGSDKEVSNVINKLCKEVVIKGFHFTTLCKDVNQYYSNIWHKRKATLKRDYFDTPWKGFSFIVAFVLFLFTIAGLSLLGIIKFFRYEV